MMRQEIVVRKNIRDRLVVMLARSRVNLVLFVLAVITLALFIVAALLQSKGMFTVTLPRLDMVNYKLVLSDTPGFERPRQELRGDPVVNMWNISGEDEQLIGLEKIDGSHNGENYFAYTFYLKNMGDRDIKYNATMFLEEVTQQVDEAMRVRFYFNDVPDIYAKRQFNSEEPEPGTIRFINNRTMIKMPEKLLKQDEVDKFTVVIWIEGDDPECVNELLGGFAKMSFQFRANPVLDKPKILV